MLSTLSSCAEEGISTSYKNQAIDVIFDMKSDLSPNKTFVLLYGDKLPLLEAPKKDYSTFLGWYTVKGEEEMYVGNGETYVSGYETISIDKYDINNGVIDIYAKFEGEEFSVNFYPDGPNYVDKTYKIKYLDKMPDLTTPSKEDSVFEYWYYLDNEEEIRIGKNEYEEGKDILSKEAYHINSSKTLDIYAKYSSFIKNVNLVLPDGTTLTVGVPYEEKIDKYVDSITYQDFSITKWSTVENDTNLDYVFDDVVYSDMTLYASEYKYYKIVFKVNGVESTYYKEPGENITPKDIPSKTGYISNGYKDEEGNIVEGTFTVTKPGYYTPSYSLFTGSTSATMFSGSSTIYTPRSANGDPTYRPWSYTFNYSNYYLIDQLKSEGYTAFSLRFNARFNIVHDGYQYFYVYSPTKELSSVKYDYNSGVSVSRTFTATVKFSDLDDDFLAVKCAASGYVAIWYSQGNDWNLTSLTVDCEPIK